MTLHFSAGYKSIYFLAREALTVLSIAVQEWVTWLMHHHHLRPDTLSRSSRSVIGEYGLPSDIVASA